VAARVRLGFYLGFNVTQLKNGTFPKGYGTIGKGKEERPAVGMASMMDEMQKTLARRRAKVEKAEEVV